MKGKATLFLGIMLALAAMPAVDATHPSTACNTVQAIHSYVLFSNVFIGADTSLVGSFYYSTGFKPIVWDSCDQDIDGDGIPFDYDGDKETGVGGGRFPAGTNGAWNGCYTPPETAHHGYGNGAQYWADDETSVASIVYSAGADGPAIIPDPTDPCATDGIISNDPTTDPADCGDGATGVYAPPIWTPATLGENIPGSGACNPFDGYVWVTIYAGVYVDGATGNVIVGTPISGHIWG